MLADRVPVPPQLVLAGYCCAGDAYSVAIRPISLLC